MFPSFERQKMHIFAESLFLFVLAVLFGIFEIEAEGRYGWGEKFPTWYRVNGAAAKLYGRITNKPLTGYHAALFFVPFFIMFWPMVATSSLTWHGSVVAFSLYFAWVVVWDFSWFVLNPYYGIEKFRRDHVWWFAKEPWLFGRIPSGYCLAWLFSLVLAAVSGGISGGWIEAFAEQLQMLGWYLAFISVLLIAGTPLYRRYYSAMRVRDERDQAGIFRS